MIENLIGSSGLALVFAIAAAVGALVFLIRLVLQIFGVGDGDVDIDFDDVTGHDSVQILSLHGLSAFFMIFGLVGLALLLESGAGEFLSIAGGFLAGTASLLVSAKMFELMARLQSSGTLVIERAIGSRGTVYLKIPAEGRGQVQVSVQNSLREFDAVSANQVEIATGESIEVVGIQGANILSVRKL